MNHGCVPNHIAGTAFSGSSALILKSHYYIDYFIKQKGRSSSDFKFVFDLTWSHPTHVQVLLHSIQGVAGAISD